MKNVLVTLNKKPRPQSLQPTQNLQKYAVVLKVKQDGSGNTDCPKDNSLT